MSPILTPVAESLRAFMRGGAFQPLWRAVMDATDTIDTAAEVSDQERAWFERVYDLIYMGAEDPVSPSERHDGVIGAAELRQQVRDAALDAVGLAPA